MDSRDPYPTARSFAAFTPGSWSERSLGARILSCYDADEVPSRDDCVGYDAVRVYDPTVEDRRRLAEEGFVWKPSWILWVLEVTDSDDAYLGLLSGRERRHVRAAARSIASRFRVSVELELQAASLEAWYRVYRERIAALRYGIPVAGELRQALLDEPGRFVGIFVYDEAELVAGTIAVRAQEGAMLRSMFSASAERYRRFDLSRGLCVALTRTARDLGCELLSLGADPNFYGHAVGTGLYEFKARLAFRPVAARRYERGGPDLLERVVSLAPFEDPSFCLAYGAGGETELEGHVFSSGAGPDTRRFRSSGVSAVHLHSVPAGTQRSRSRR